MKSFEGLNSRGLTVVASVGPEELEEMIPTIVALFVEGLLTTMPVLPFRFVEEGIFVQEELDMETVPAVPTPLIGALTRRGCVMFFGANINYR